MLDNLQPRGVDNPKPVGDSSIYLLRTRGLRAPSSPIPGVGLGGFVPLVESTVLEGLVPHTESTALGGLEPLAESTVLVGSCPALNMLPWVGSLSPPPHFTIFAHTSYE